MDFLELEPELEGERERERERERDPWKRRRLSSVHVRALQPILTRTCTRTRTRIRTLTRIFTPRPLQNLPGDASRQHSAGTSPARLLRATSLPSHFLRPMPRPSLLTLRHTSTLRHMHTPRLLLLPPPPSSVHSLHPLAHSSHLALTPSSQPSPRPPTHL